MTRGEVTRFAAEAAAAEVDSRKPAGDPDAFWLTEAQRAIDGVAAAIEQLRHARALSADVAHAVTSRERHDAEHREGFARERAWRTAVAATALLLASLADHPFTAEIPPLRRVH